MLAAPRIEACVLSLKRAIRRLETETIAETAPAISFGIGAIDGALGGGLSRGMLHEIAAANETEIAAASGFALALTVRNASLPAHANVSAQPRAIAWIAEDMACRESGALYGPGLDAWIAPERLILVRVARSRDVAWAMEEALRCRAVGTVIGEVRKPLDLVATRRLSLAAARGGGAGFLLRAMPGTDASAAATRWIVGASPPWDRRSREHPPPGIGPPRVLLRLLRNRRGHLGSWMVEWNCAEQRFDPAPAHLEPVVSPALDRPHRAVA